METKGKRENGWLLTGITLVVMMALGVGAWFQLSQYERGVLEIYAKQQDGYVQLVLDQINLLDEGGSEEQVESILSTLDASSNRYWVLSDRDALIFVKDTQETSRYRSYTPDAYYTSSSAREFIQGLSTNRVIHATIEVDGREYIASGVQFAYHGGVYRVCLLTNAQFILMENTYLNAKITVMVVMVAALAAVVLLGSTLSATVQRQRDDLLREKERAAMLEERVEKLNDKLDQEEFYDTRQVAFYPQALPTVLERVARRDVWPMALEVYDCGTAWMREIFLINAQVVLDQKVLRFLLDDRRVLLLSLRYKERSQHTAMAALDAAEVRRVGHMVLVEPPQEPLLDVVARFLKVECKNGK